MENKNCCGNVINRDIRFRRMKILFPNCPNENINEYLDYSDDGSDYLNDEQLDADFEDFSSK